MLEIYNTVAMTGRAGARTVKKHGFQIAKHIKADEKKGHKIESIEGIDDNNDIKRNLRGTFGLTPSD